MTDRERNKIPDHLFLPGEISCETLSQKIFDVITKFFIKLTLIEIDLGIKPEDSCTKFFPHESIKNALMEELLNNKTPEQNYVFNKIIIRKVLEKYTRLTRNHYENIYKRQEWVISMLTDEIFNALYELMNS